MQLPDVKAVVLDMDGVLWQDDQPLVDLPVVFAQMESLGWKILFATNNSTRTPSFFAQKLKAMGVEAQPSTILTSSLATAYLLRKSFPRGGPIFLVGEDGLETALKEAGFYHQEEEVIAVVAGMDRNLTYAKMSKATLHIRSGVPFFASNPDRTFPTPEGLLPGAGAVIAMLQAASDVDPIWAGKPNPTLYRMAMEQLDLHPNEVLAVGDRLETDILGGFRAGCPTALVCSGVSTRAMANAYQPRPTIIAKDLAELVTMYVKRR